MITSLTYYNMGNTFPITLFVGQVGIKSIEYDRGWFVVRYNENTNALAINQVHVISYTAKEIEDASSTQE